MRHVICIAFALFVAACSGAPTTSDAPPTDVVVEDFDLLPAAGAAVTGRSDALVTLHTFVDPASPSFAVLVKEFERMNAANEQELRLVVRAPARPSPAGYDALVALRAAGMQGKQVQTWEALSQWRSAWATGGAIALVASMSEEIGLDREQLRLAIEDGSAARIIDAEKEWAGKYGVDGALAFNARLYFEMFEPVPLDAALAATLEQARTMVDQGAPRASIFAKSAHANLDADPFGQPFIDSDLIPLGKSPTFGNQSGVVKVVAFLDFQCPYSKLAAITMSQLVAANHNVEFAFKHLPLPFHEQARDAAAIAVAAAAQGRFWEMSEQLFLHQQRLENENLDELAAEFGNRIGLDVPRLLADREAAYEVVDADMRLGQKLGVRGTPNFFVNGVRLQGALPLEAFQEAVAARVTQANSMDVMAREIYAAAVLENFEEPSEPPPTAAPPRPEPPPYAFVPVDDSDPVQGGKNFQVTIVEFADYQCPFCQRAQDTMKRLREEHPEVRFVYKHRPLPFHKSAASAAAAAVAAGKQGKFWQMHDALFAERRLPDIDEIDAFTEELAVRLTLKQSKFKKDRAAAADKVKADDALAVSVGANGTPTFFINGRRFVGARPYEEFVAAIEEELAFAQEVAAETKATRAKLYEEVMRRRTAEPTVED